MKNILITLFITLSFISYASAEGNPEYIDSGFKINNQTIWIGFNLMSENNICVDIDENKKECLFHCQFCNIPLFQDADGMYMLPVDNKGIFYMEDEFHLKYYDLNSKKDVQIINGIYKLLSDYEIDEDVANFMDDRYFNPFTDNSLNSEKDKLAIEIAYNDPPTMEVLAPMICIIDMEKLSANNEDYIKCPIITKEMRNIDYTKVPENTWESGELPILSNWTNDDKINIKTEVGDDYVLDVDNNTLEKKPSNYVSLVITALSLFGIVGIVFFLRRKGK